MNGASHYLSSVFITLLIYKLIPGEELSKTMKTVRIAIIFIVNFFFHIIIDNLANFTYHPSDADWGDPIYASWHIFTYVLEAAVAIYILRKDLRYAWGMVGSVGFDLWDWSIVRFLGKYADIELPTIHFMEGYVNNAIFFWTPNWTQNQPALVVEVLFVALLFYLWQKLAAVWPLPGAMPGSKKSIGALIVLFGLWRLMSLF